MPRERAAAFAPGRVNLIGEHTDYNRGLALPFAIAEGVTVHALATVPGAGAGRVVADALDLGGRDEFALAVPPPSEGWPALARGAVAELSRAGFPLIGCELEISGDVPLGSGLSSSAALEVALCLALIELGRGESAREDLDRLQIARVCARVEHRWVGAQTGLLDQLASLFGAPDAALLIDFDSLALAPVALALGDWSLVVLDSGQRHVHAASGYNERRAECARACELLGVTSLREADREAAARLPAPLCDRALHVIEENARVLEAVAALAAADLPALGVLLNASHASLRERYAVSTPAVEATVQRLLGAGAAGARLIGGGFGGSVLGLFPPAAAGSIPAAARTVRPSAGAHLLAP